MNEQERAELKAAVEETVKTFEVLNADIKLVCRNLNRAFDDDPVLTSACGVAMRSMDRLRNLVISRLDGLLTQEDA
tara:strand:- start:59 stop:286 length:228 start_codon:yes stop_codon:yes gene_type:complete